MPFLNDPRRIKTMKTLILNGGSSSNQSESKRHMTYCFSADDGYNEKYHCEIVDSILQESRRWNSLNIEFSNSGKKNADVSIRLCTDSTIVKKCGFSGLSCAEVGGHNIYLNGSNWLRGASASGLSLENYRKYALTHEMCHILGFLHETCESAGKNVSIMMQQTLGTGDCKPFEGNLHFNNANPPKVKTKWD